MTDTPTNDTTANSNKEIKLQFYLKILVIGLAVLIFATITVIVLAYVKKKQNAKISAQATAISINKEVDSIETKLPEELTKESITSELSSLNSNKSTPYTTTYEKLMPPECSVDVIFKESYIALFSKNCNIVKIITPQNQSILQLDK